MNNEGKGAAATDYKALYERSLEDIRQLKLEITELKLKLHFISAETVTHFQEKLRDRVADRIYCRYLLCMALFIASLNSGSNGNCYYIGNRREAVLVDAGLSCKETERRMDACGLSMDLVKAIFVSHEHTDHIKGLERLSRKYDLPVYITAPTLVNSRLQLDPRHVRNFGTQQASVHWRSGDKGFPENTRCGRPA